MFTIYILTLTQVLLRDIIAGKPGVTKMHLVDIRLYKRKCLMDCMVYIKPKKNNTCQPEDL